MTYDISDLARRVATGDRRALARAITLVESGRADHRVDAMGLLDVLATGGNKRSASAFPAPQALGNPPLLRALA